MNVTLLGTSCMFPTKERAQPGVLAVSGSEYLLIDCGEGIQRQLRIAGISPMKINRIFITHWHGDHSLGLAGMIQSMAGNKRTAPLHIYGPKGTKEKVESLVKIYEFHQSYDLLVHEFSLKTGELKDALITPKITVKALGLKHAVPTLGYIIKEADSLKINLEFTKKYGLTQHPLLGKLQKGEDIIYNKKKIKSSDATILKKGKLLAYVTDTQYFKGLEQLIKGADLLICESTYASNNELKASEHHHLTAEDAGRIAKLSNASKLVLTHFSQRYDDVKHLIKEAKKEFPKVIEGKDFMTIKL